MDLARLLAAMAFLVATSVAQADPVRVLIVGDSISTSGSGGISGEGPGLAFADQLPIDLGPDFEVIHAACGGASSIDWSLTTPGRICPETELPDTPFVPSGLFVDRALPELPVEIATVLLGTNDATGGFFELEPVEPDAYETAIQELLEALLGGGAETVLLMTPPPVSDAPSNELLQQYRERLLGLCDTGDGVVCGPDLHTLLQLETDFAIFNPFTGARDIHPNAEGHDKIEAALVSAVIQAPEPATDLAQWAALFGVAVCARRHARTRKATCRSRSL